MKFELNKSRTQELEPQHFAEAREALRAMDAQFIYDLLMTDSTAFEAVEALNVSQAKLNDQAVDRLFRYGGVEPPSRGFKVVGHPEVTETLAAEFAQDLVSAWYPDEQHYLNFLDENEAFLVVLRSLEPEGLKNIEKVFAWYVDTWESERAHLHAMARKVSGWPEDPAEVQETVKAFLDSTKASAQASYQSPSDYVESRCAVLEKCADFEKRLWAALAGGNVEIVQEFFPQYSDPELENFYQVMLPKLREAFEKQAAFLWSESP